VTDDEFYRELRELRIENKRLQHQLEAARWQISQDSDENFLDEIEKDGAPDAAEGMRLLRMVRERDAKLKVAIQHIDKDRQHYHLRFCGKGCPGG
jgi:hypothetical protein